MGNAAVPPEVEAYFEALDERQARRRAAGLRDGPRRDAGGLPPRRSSGGCPAGWCRSNAFPTRTTSSRWPTSVLAAQKNYNSLYLMAIYSDTEEDRRFRARPGRVVVERSTWARAACRFRTLADVDLDLVAETVAAFPVERFLETYERIRVLTGRPEACRNAPLHLMGE